MVVALLNFMCRLQVPVADSNMKVNKDNNNNNNTLITHVHETFRIADIPAEWE